MLLLLSTSESVHTDLVEDGLQARDTRYLRFDTDTFPRVAKLEARLSGEGIDGWITDGSERVPLRDVSAVWWHHVAPPAIAKEAEPTFRSWVEAELSSAIETVITALEVPIWPDPDAVNAAGRKWRQLRVAKELGFRVPDSLLTSSPDSLRNFARSATVFKTLSHPEVSSHDGTPARQVYTSLLADVDVCKAELLRHSIGFFQHFVTKRRDLRVTVVGDVAIAVAIESQDSEQTRVDWRRYDVPRTRHEVVALPMSVERKCREFLEFFSLDFGAFDFAEDAEGELWFLELNPNGLWAWLEFLTGAPISDSIAERLTSLAKTQD